MSQKRVVLLLAFFLSIPAFTMVAFAQKTEVKKLLDETAWPDFVKSRELKISVDDDKATRLLKERFNVGQIELRDRYAFWLQGSGGVREIHEVAERVTEARLEAGGAKSDRIAILKEKVVFAKAIEKQVDQVQRTFGRSSTDATTAVYFRADAELELLKAENAAKE